MSVDVVALDHLYVAVSDLEASEAFYDPVMRLLDFRKGTKPIAGEPHVHYFNRVLRYTLRPARGDARRRTIRERWSDLTAFEEPLEKAGLGRR